MYTAEGYYMALRKRQSPAVEWDKVNMEKVTWQALQKVLERYADKQAGLLAGHLAEVTTDAGVRAMYNDYRACANCIRFVESRGESDV